MKANKKVIPYEIYKELDHCVLWLNTMTDELGETSKINHFAFKYYMEKLDKLRERIGEITIR
jgi:hypothetical protein